MKRGLTGKIKADNDLLYYLMLALTLLLAGFAVALQPDMSLLTGLWKIQVGHAGLITDPICTGGPGAALLNAALMLFGSTMLVRLQKMPFTGLSVACLFMMGGFALLGKNVINSLPVMIGGFLFACYKSEPFSKYSYISLFGTCLSPMVSYFMLHTDPQVHFVAMILGGAVIGFVMPAVSGYMVRIHQGYNLYNVGFSAGFVGLALVSILRGTGMEFQTQTSWSTEYDLPLTILMACILLGLFVLGVALGCRKWRSYRRLLKHTGRAVSDFFVLEGMGVTFVNMALVGLVGVLYLKLVRVPLNGPLVCCLFAMVGFGAFGKHPRNVIPVMAGAVICASCSPVTGVPEALSSVISPFARSNTFTFTRTAPSHHTKSSCTPPSRSRFSYSAPPSRYMKPIHSDASPKAEVTRATFTPLPAATSVWLSTRFRPPAVKPSTARVRSMLGFRETEVIMYATSSGLFSFPASYLPDFILRTLRGRVNKNFSCLPFPAQRLIMQVSNYRSAAHAYRIQDARLLPIRLRRNPCPRG